MPITVPAADDDERCAKLLAQANEAVKAGPVGAASKPEPLSSKGRSDTPKAPPAQAQPDPQPALAAPVKNKAVPKFEDNPLYQSN